MIHTFERIAESGDHGAMTLVHRKGEDHESRQHLVKTSTVDYEYDGNMYNGIEVGLANMWPWVTFKAAW